MKLSFKICTISDLEQLLAISKKTFIDAFEKDNDPIDFKSYLATAFTKTSLLEQLNNRNSTFYLVFSDTSLVGYFKLNSANAQTELKLNLGTRLNFDDTKP